MAEDPIDDRKLAARKRAQDRFTAAEVRDATLRHTLDKERAVSNAKTAKLRALRLAKEAADAEEARLHPPASAPKKPVIRMRK